LVGSSFAEDFSSSSVISVLAFSLFVFVVELEVVVFFTGETSQDFRAKACKLKENIIIPKRAIHLEALCKYMDCL
jgi:hypothetical protein